MTVLRPRHSHLSKYQSKEFSFFLGRTMLEAPMENELAGLH